MSLFAGLVLKHWRTVLLGAVVLAGCLGCAELGRREGYSRGYTAGWQSAPPCPKIEVKNEQPQVECKQDAEVRYVKVQIPGPSKECPTTLFLPELRYGSNASSMGGSVAVSAGVPDHVAGGEAPRALPPPTTRSSAGGNWRALLLGGVGGDGGEVGAYVGRTFWGHVDVGVYGRAPVGAPGHASAGIGLGVAW